MRGAGMACGIVLVLLAAGAARGQNVPTSAHIDTVAIELTMPDRYDVSEVLQPIRRVVLVAAADGTIRSLNVRLGSTAKESQELAELDRGEAAARLKAAQAEVKEKQAMARTNQNAAYADVYQAQLEAAQARAELAQIELNRCTVRAPFAGRVVDLPVTSGQYVLKGTPILELADTSSLKALQAVDRRRVAAGSSLALQVEGQDVAGKVQAIVPLPDSYLTLRELVTPLAAAWLIVPNPKSELEPGMRVRTSTIPSSPVAVIPKRAIKHDSPRGGEGAIVQVLRNDFDNNLPAQVVTNLPVRVLGDVGTERAQVSGAFRPSDALVVATSSPLLAGTLVKFPEGAGPRPSDAISRFGGGAGNVGSTGSRGGSSSTSRARGGGSELPASSARARSQQNPSGRQSGEATVPY
jgi:multidrug efflux pump subunit AcrA (membrane-fusion protein)